MKNIKIPKIKKSQSGTIITTVFGKEYVLIDDFSPGIYCKRKGKKFFVPLSSILYIGDPKSK